MSRVYLETTIPSYLAAKPSRDLIVAAHQQITRDWWENRSRFDLFISQIVIQEISSGGQEAAAKRLEFTDNIPVLALTDEAESLAAEFISQTAFPKTAVVDAVHVAIAVINGMDYLLTWNCAHIANASLRVKIEQICRSKHYEPPVICTPEELMET